MMPRFDGWHTVTATGDFPVEPFNRFVTTSRPQLAHDPWAAAFEAMRFSTHDVASVTATMQLTAQSRVTADPPSDTKQQATVTLSTEGHLDDAISGTRFVLVFARQTSECGRFTCDEQPIPWELESAVRTCQSGRPEASTEFTAEACSGL